MGITQGVSKLAKWTHLSMRFPPFDAPSHIPKEMYKTDIYWPHRDKKENDLSIGSANGWFIHRVVSDDLPNSAKLITEHDSKTETEKLLSSRIGWGLSPHPLHSIARRWIPYGVVILIFAIVMHVLEPVLLGGGFISERIAGSINLGLLDYPILFVMAAPFVAIPIIFRVLGNVADIRRQHMFKNNLPKSPKITVSNPSTTGPIKVKVTIPDQLENRELYGYIRVGLLPPHRNAMMSALSGGESDYPPVGLSTLLPIGWMKHADDGSGIGESTPMLIGRGSSSLFIEPMRIQVNGSRQSISSDVEIELETPNGPWPASEFGPFVNINWELVLEFHSGRNRPLYWIERLSVGSIDNSHSVPQLIAHGGRLEST